jgi:tetratricopeptide (TPR) repeat protein
VVAIAAGVILYRVTRPEVRRPGEELDDITERLSRNIPAEAPTPMLIDVAAEAGLGETVSFLGDRTSQLPEDMGSGLAWGDYDNDGDDDLLLVGVGGSLESAPETWAPTRLFRNRGNGTFEFDTSFPELRIMGMAAAWGDYDGDGWLDLVISGFNELKLFHNENGRLVESDLLGENPGYWSGASWADIDNDRDLDLYVCGYVKYELAGPGETRVSEQYGTAVPYTLNPASFEPERNLLFVNEGGGFTEMAQLYGVSNPAGRSLGALWHDFDADGLLDLYVANDISDNALFLNKGGTFEDASLSAWVADYRGAMGLAAGDWNRDGDDDLFVTHWVAQENALYDSRLLDIARARERDGVEGPPVPLSFQDQAAPLGLGQIALHSVGWGTEFVDLDGDGWLDLLVSNGSTLETEDEPPLLKPQSMFVLWNRAGEFFHDLAPLDEALAKPRVGRGLAISDFDADGDQDIAVVRWGEPPGLLRNDMQRGNWAQFRLKSKGPDGELVGFGDGATVAVRTGDLELRRTVGGSSYLSQSSRTLHFGLGAVATIDSVEVRWLGGETETWGPLTAGTLWELSEGVGEARNLREGLSATSDRERLVAFWTKQRAAMDAFKRERDCEAAVPLFREALALDPTHGDSRYYLGNCLATMGEFDEALAQLDELRQRDPMSHRAHKQYGVLRAMVAESQDDLLAAKAALGRAHEINSEATGALIVLGELELILGRHAEAAEHLEHACRTNPKAVGGFFLRGYIEWLDGDAVAAGKLLEQARAALGPEWKPEGTVAEGDVKKQMHEEATPLSRYWEAWDGNTDPTAAYATLAERLKP